MMVGTVTDGRGSSAPTVYTVLAQSARSHSRRYLTAEALLAGTAAGLILLRQPRWWPAALLVLAVGLYASWGLLAHGRSAEESTPWPRLLRVVLAGLATAATLSGLGGLAVKTFWGTAPGPYGMCHEPDGASHACNADGSRRPMTRPPS